MTSCLHLCLCCNARHRRQLGTEPVKLCHAHRLHDKVYRCTRTTNGCRHTRDLSMGSHTTFIVPRCYKGARSSKSNYLIDHLPSLTSSVIPTLATRALRYSLPSSATVVQECLSYKLHIAHSKLAKAHSTLQIKKTDHQAGKAIIHASSLGMGTHSPEDLSRLVKQRADNRSSH